MRDLGLRYYGGKPLKRFVRYNQELMDVDEAFSLVSYRSLFRALSLGFELFEPLRARIANGTRQEPPDMSVGDALRVVFSEQPHLVDDFCSAIIHGMSGGNINKTSLRSLIPVMVEWYAQPYPLHKFGTCAMRPQDLALLNSLAADPFIREKAAESSQYSYIALPDGLSGLTDSLESMLRLQSNVKIRTSTPVDCIDRGSRTDKILV